MTALPESGGQPAGADVERKHFRIHGKVQGVFFRRFTKMKADDHRVTGWVRNNADSTVEGEVQGPRDVVDAFLAHLRRGPSDARVDSCEVTALATLEAEHESEFEVHTKAKLAEMAAAEGAAST